jgi:endonuclease YncB( thermonuclease family)
MNLRHSTLTRRRPIRVGVTVVALVVALSSSPVAHAAHEVMGKAVRVTSGDTLVVTSAEGDTEVRLADIGAPQGSAYYAPAATTLLSNMVLGLQVRVTATGQSAPGHVFGRVYVGDLDVILALVQRGAAWVCLEYAANTDLIPYENDAMRYRRGLWAWTTQFDARVACQRRPPAEHPIGKPQTPA